MAPASASAAEPAPRVEVKLVAPAEPPAAPAQAFVPASPEEPPSAADVAEFERPVRK
jgi:hypothetical protein